MVLEQEEVILKVGIGEIWGNWVRSWVKGGVGGSISLKKSIRYGIGRILGEGRIL